MPEGADPHAVAGAAHCEAIVRAADPDRYFATLFAPAQHRPALFALYAFSQEIARIREIVSDPLPGEIRFQWWRDALEGEARGDVRANPLAAGLDDAIIAYRLPRKALTDLLDARIFDLYDDPMPTLGDLEGYCGETSSSLIRLASLVLAGGEEPGGAEAAGHAGVGFALTGLLRAFPWHARRGQIYLPADLMARHGVTREDIVEGRGGPGLSAALADLRRVARSHIEHTRALRASITPLIAPAFLPVALATPYLDLMERPGYDPFRTVVDLPQWRKQWILWRQARRAARV